MPAITFTPSGKTVTVEPGTTLAEACRKAGFPLPTPCGGKGICGKCRVRVFGEDEMRNACVTPAYDDMTLHDPEEEKGSLVLTYFAFHDISGLPDGMDPGTLGLAVDLGTTTLAAALCDPGTGKPLSFASRANPQSVHGDDVISRIEYASRDSAARDEMQRLIVDALQELAAESLRNAGLPGGRISRIAIGANTAMNHLLMGVDPEPLTHSPFTPAFLAVAPFGAEEIGWESREGSPPPRVLIVPNIASFVGGDVTAGLLAHNILESKRITLFLDIGTNGETVLAANGETYACATAAGPAFEGARITHGMQAVPGAISGVRADANGELVFDAIGGVRPAKGICGTGLLDAVAALLRTGRIDETGQMTGAGAGEIWLEPGTVALTQKDVREFQLAKGALAAGVRILLDAAGVRAEDVDDVFLAGGFGTCLDPESALATGLLPQGIRAEKIRAVGNASLAGTRLCLLSEAERKRAEEIAKRIRYVELSGRADFSSAFAEEMLFPVQS